MTLRNPSPVSERIPTVAAGALRAVVFLWSVLRFPDLLMITPIIWNLAAIANNTLRGKV